MFTNTLATALVCGAREGRGTGLGIADHLRRVRIGLGFSPPSLGEQSGCSIRRRPTAAMRWAGARQLPHPVRKTEETVGSCDNPLGCRRIAVADYPLPRGEHRRQVRTTVSLRRIGSRTRFRRDADREILLYGLAMG
jgi:hypothetical protein